MSGRRDCIFVQGRACPFPSQEIPLQTCQVCVEAWKTEASLRLKATLEPVNAVAATNAGSVTEVQETRTRLGELDQMFMDDNLNPAEYVRLRKRQTERIVDGSKPRISLDTLEVEAPEPRETRLALIIRSFMGSKVHTQPEGWELPAAINDDVVDQLLRLAAARGDEETRAGVAGYKVTVVRHPRASCCSWLWTGTRSSRPVSPRFGGSQSCSGGSSTG